jgi:hypothetical protein
VSAKRLLLLPVAAWLGLGMAFASAGGAWKFEVTERGHPELKYSQNDKTVFLVGCGHAFGLHAVYPGGRRREGAKAIIVIANARTRMTFVGDIESPYEDDPPNTTHFVQWDLGFIRQDPALYGKRWKRLEHRLLNLLDSRQQLTISAAGRSYVLPAVNVPKWKKRFKEIC